MNSYTVSQLASAHDCGNRAWGLGQGEKIEENFGLLLGRELDSLLEEYAADLTELPEAITVGLPPLHKILKAQYSFNKDIAGVNIRGRIDFATKLHILDAKLGEIRERDRVQMSIYLRALEYTDGELIQFGYNRKGPDKFTFRENHPIKSVASDELIQMLSEKIESRKLPEKKIEACKNCHFKTTCPITVGVSELADQAADIRHEIGEKMTQLENVEKQLKTLPAKAYPTKWGSYMVSVSNRRHVASTALTKHPVKDFPDMWADPKPILDEFAKVEGAIYSKESKTLKWEPKEETKSEK